MIIYTAQRGKKGVSECRKRGVPGFEFALRGRAVGLTVEDLLNPGVGEGSIEPFLPGEGGSRRRRTSTMRESIG